jgi:hypothetical protein
MLIRLLTFRPGAPGEVTDEFLRRSLLSEIAAQPELRHVHAGRVMAEAGGRVVLTVWERDLSRLNTPLLMEQSELVLDPVVETSPASVALAFGSAEDAQIMRIFRGRTHTGQAEAYLDAVREGTLADVAGGRGPLALFVGMLDDESFLAVSIWSSWESIEQATGGNIRQPLATRHRELLLEGAADHFEVVPNASLVSTPSSAGGAAPGTAAST